MNEHFNKQNEESEKQQNMLNNKSGKNLERPNIAPSPTYVTKNAPKK